MLGGIFLFKIGGKTNDFGTTFVARRGPLEIIVLQGGSVESEEKGEIKCEVKVEQGIKILKIVEEGYQVTEEDIKTNKVLIELNSTEMRNKITQQEITFGSTVASLTDAMQSYDIQLNQNISDVKAAEQKAEFTRMDFEKYLGEQAANEIIAELGIKTNDSESVIPSSPSAGMVRETKQANSESKPVDVDSTTVKTNTPSAANSKEALAVKTTNENTNSATPSLLMGNYKLSAVDFSRYADTNKLGDGEAKQKLRELLDAVQIARKEKSQAESIKEGAVRLYAKDFVTKIELERDSLAYENAGLKVEKAQTALRLFERYEFRKMAQETLSKYVESLRELDRTRKGAVSKLAQADAKLKSAQAKHGIEEAQLKELKEQLAKTIIKARRPGLVVYGSGGELRYWRDEEQIREGATVREGQTLLTVPDMRKMCIKVKIHESYIKRIQKGQKVRITADSFPDRKLEGEVTQVGVLPDSENSWFNPDMKMYRCTIAIGGQNDWIRPGMSAKVQIIVNQLSNVVYVPIQAVNPVGGKKVCYVLNSNRADPREVEVGEFNDEFIEIKRGIQQGERICLRKPSGHDAEAGTGKDKQPAGPEKTKEKSNPQNMSSGGSGSRT